ncbi:hypothetical protein ANCCAN_13043 [Ancylostoma caninum]|uniref:Uncharacterized protein n=1 Tax=Ancylostoma caninum TaxID=29170 RepID=A0A368G9G8_ANCCA|nr:hypothetical protein ANCCAN_13042 [Ancylostoma caninum]RCN41036.1 hypothetical protein ANCCAN_13043 [Ancylostoma caninum]
MGKVSTAMKVLLSPRLCVFYLPYSQCPFKLVIKE